MIAPLLSRRGWTAAVVLSVLAGWGVGVRAGHGRRPEAGATVRFVACPIYRDTDQGRKSGCWLADDPATGARYDLTWSPIKPQAGKPVLVEGVVTEASDTCGGVVLQPVRVSVLPEPGCTREILAAEGYPGRPSPPPVAMLAPSSQPRTLPPPPYVRRAFHIYFEFGRRFLQYQHAEVILEQVQLYVRASDAKRVRIVGFAATEPVRYGQRRLAEPDRLALDRAEIVALALHRLGVPDAIVAIQVSKAPAPTELEGGRLPESSKRRVTVMVTPLTTLSQRFEGVWVKLARVTLIGCVWTRSLSRAGALREWAASDSGFLWRRGHMSRWGGDGAPFATLGQRFEGVWVKLARVTLIGCVWTRSLGRAGALRGWAASDSGFLWRRGHMLAGAHYGWAAASKILARPSMSCSSE